MIEQETEEMFCKNGDAKMKNSNLIWVVEQLHSIILQHTMVKCRTLRGRKVIKDTEASTTMARTRWKNNNL